MEESGEDVPALRNRPPLQITSRPYWDAFQELTSSRQWMQAGPTAIPYPSIVLWLDENMIGDVDERADFITIIQRLDAGYLNIQYAKINSKTKT